MRKIKRALISVSDKTGIVELAKLLQSLNCEIISTGGTQKVLEEAGITVTEISSITGNPEAFGGRMKTISFKIESALLFDREKDAEEALKLGIEPIDLVVCNLYPFSQVKATGAELPRLIENIDIGGPTMIRAAAKNYKSVAVVTDVKDYSRIMEELRANQGAISLATRFDLMRQTFNHTADYDALIATTMDEEAGQRSLRFSYIAGKELRYGENSHQKGYLYRCAFSPDSLADLKILHGKEISYNNLSDIQSALEAVRDLKEQGCSIIKHNNPCGLAQGSEQRKVLEEAWAGDPISAFGSILAFNHSVGKHTVEFLQLDHPDKKQRKFIEVIVAPEFTESAKEYLFQHRNLRVLEFDPHKCVSKFEMKKLTGALLVQDTDNKLFNNLLSVTTKSFDTDRDRELIEFGLKAVKQIKSNAIAIVRKLINGDCQLLGMGAGQPNRLISTKLAIDKAKENLQREAKDVNIEKYLRAELAKAIMVSDAFFPFPDNIELAGEAGITRIIQPGGSLRDKLVIRKCNELEIAMLFTGFRHFKH